MIKKNKLILTLGTTAAIIAPAISLISCGQETTIKEAVETQYNFVESDFKLITNGPSLINPLHDDRIPSTIWEWDSVKGEDVEVPNPDYKYSSTVPLEFRTYKQVDLKALKNHIDALDYTVKKIDLAQIQWLGKANMPIYIQNEFWTLFPELSEVVDHTARGINQAGATFLINTNKIDGEYNGAPYKGGYLNNLPISLKVIGDYAFNSKKIRTKGEIEDLGDGKLPTPPGPSQEVQELVLPLALEKIGESAFENNRIYELKLPDTVTSLGKRAFAKNEIRTLTLPKSLDTINAQTFLDNNIDKVLIYDATKWIEPDAFRNNSISDLTLPNQLKYITRSSFENNELEDVNLYEGLSKIFDRAFYENRFLDISIPDSVTYIGKQAFASNKYLLDQAAAASKTTVIKLSENLEEIGKEAFADGLIQRLELPEKLTTIGDAAFRGNKIKSINFGTSLKTIAKEMFRDNLLMTVDIPDSIKTIEEGAFQTNMLSTMTLGANIENIGAHAFANNKLTEVVIPNTVLNIEANAFANNHDWSTDSNGDTVYTNLLKKITIPGRFKNRFEEIFRLKESDFTSTDDGQGNWVFEQIAP